MRATLLALVLLVTVVGGSEADDTAKQTAARAKQVLATALDEHHALTAEAALLREKLVDLAARKQTANQRLQERTKAP